MFGGVGWGWLRCLGVFVVWLFGVYDTEVVVRGWGSVVLVGFGGWGSVEG